MKRNTVALLFGLIVFLSGCHNEADKDTKSFTAKTAALPRSFSNAATQATDNTIEQTASVL